MFNRALQVKMVKNAKKKENLMPDETDQQFEGKVAIAGYYLEHVVDKIGRAVLAYLVIDTVRQVMVARATK